jgi:hypothetical protein
MPGNNTRSNGTARRSAAKLCQGNPGRTEAMKLATPLAVFADRTGPEKFAQHTKIGLAKQVLTVVSKVLTVLTQVRDGFECGNLGSEPGRGVHIAISGALAFVPHTVVTFDRETVLELLLHVLSRSVCGHWQPPARLQQRSRHA